MKISFIISLTLLAFIAFMCISIANTGQKKRIQQKLITENSVPHSTNKQKVPITEAFQFVKQHKMDTTIAILIDYKQHSGKKRGFIIDLKLKLIRDSFLVAHGCGDNNWSMDQSKDAPKFSNAFDSHCSSLGKYKIGARAYSDWGIHVKYLLYGLETSNSNAYKRTIVLHGWESIPDIEPYPNGVPEGWGCPAVSNETMAKLDAFLSDTKRPVLLWAY